MARSGIDASRAVSAAPTGTEAYAYHLIRALLPLLPAAEVRLYCREQPPAVREGGGQQAPPAEPARAPEDDRARLGLGARERQAARQCASSAGRG